LGIALLVAAQEQPKPVPPPVEPRPAVKLQLKDVVRLQVRQRVGGPLQLKRGPIRRAVPLQLEVQVGAELKDTKPVRSSTPARTSNPPQQAPVQAAKNRTDKLKFLNGDNLSGKFQGIQDGQVIWRHPSIAEPVRVKLDAVEQIRMVTPAGKQRQHNCSVELVNGDTFQGDLIELTETELVIDTWYGGLLKMPRKSVRYLRPGQSSSRILYEGPDGGPDNWQTGNRNNSTVPMRRFGFNQIQPANGPGVPAQLAIRILGKMPMQAGISNIQKWRFVDNGFNASTSGPMLGRTDLTFPDRTVIEFDFQWSNYFNLGVNLYADTIKNEYTGNSYSLRIDRSTVYLYRIDNNRQVRVGINAQSNMSTRTRSRVAIYVDKPKKTIALMMDGKLIHKWQDKAGKFAGKGNGLLFTSRNSYPMRLSNFRISEWDGNLPEAGGNNKGNGKEDFVQFNNDDTVHGQAKGIKDGKLTMKMSFTEVPLELKTITLLELANPPVKSIPKPSEVRARMRSHGQLTLKMESWSNGKVRVRSPYFGTADFDPAVFEKLEFNRHVPRRRGGDNIFGP
jgi:hypothetical protein